MARKKNSNDDPEQQGNAENSDDTFGLPEIEYEPLKREESPAEQKAEEPAYSQTRENPSYRQEVHNEYTSNYDDDDEPSSPWPKIFAVLAILLVAGGAYWYFGRYQPAQRQAEKERQEAARAAAERRETEEREARERANAEAEQRRADSLANLAPKEGTIETLSERTRRYYVVVASAIDGDLIMDHAKRLSVKGVSTKIIPPFGKAKFYRLAIAEGETYADTQARADGMKGEYGEGVWVIKY